MGIRIAGRLRERAVSRRIPDRQANSTVTGSGARVWIQPEPRGAVPPSSRTRLHKRPHMAKCLLGSRIAIGLGQQFR